MKSILSVFAFVSLLILNQAHAVQANINQIFCQGGKDGVGTVTVTFTGLQTFNITETNAFGFPFTQQALLQNVDYIGGKLYLEMTGTLSGLNYTLVLKNGTSNGKISSKEGALPLNCSADISGI